MSIDTNTELVRTVRIPVRIVPEYFICKTVLMMKYLVYVIKLDIQSAIFEFEPWDGVSWW